MKARSRLLELAASTLLTWSVIATARGTEVTFDELSEVASASFIANGYQGLNWSNMFAHNGILTPTVSPFITNGYYYGTVSLSNSAGSTGTAEISAMGTNFDFLSAYLTGAFRSHLNIEVQGFRSGLMVYDQTVVASVTNPTLFTFNYLNIDRIYFNSSGGLPNFGTISGPHFAMDNFTFEFVPEPSALLLTAAGVLLLWPMLRRKRGRPANTPSCRPILL